jgi:hypothetical protein
LIQDLAPGVTAINEPKRIAAGAPDYAILRGSGAAQRILGHIEAKDMGVALDVNTDQMKRYLSSLRNLAFTDYLEFRFYLDGKPHGDARVASVGRDGHLHFESEDAARLEELLEVFLGRGPELIRSPQDLARRMAKLAHMIRDVAVKGMREGVASDDLLGTYKTFKKTLIPDLDEGQFGDMFAQTLAYGLFAARYNHKGAQPFRRNDAASEIPRANPFLRKLFGDIS